MTHGYLLDHPKLFSELLYQKMIQINPGTAELELYEFCYALERLIPDRGWESISWVEPDELDRVICQRSYFEKIQLKPVQNGKIVLDDTIVHLTRLLFAGLVMDVYPLDWVRERFYFDLRSFLFYVRTRYFTPAVLSHFGCKPYQTFPSGQVRFDVQQDIGYREYQLANREVDEAFIQIIRSVVAASGTPFLMTIAGPTASGKTEIVERLRGEMEKDGRRVNSIEMDHFYKDREFRDGHSLNQEVIHFEIFQNAMRDLMAGKRVTIPQYDFYAATSSHDLEGRLRPGAVPLEISPADILFLEGNFPFHIPEIARWIGLKVAYLADDPVRLKRKWKRDIDYRKKYDINYFCNRYFRTQYLRAVDVYQPLMEVCDMVVDTTSAAIWLLPQLSRELHPLT